MVNDYTKIELQLSRYKNVNNLMQYVNNKSLLEQHNKQIKNKATGIDNVTKSEYEKNKEKNIEKLLEDMKKFKYKPKAVRRAYIPKVGSNKLRPLGIPSYEDKLVQGVFAEVLTEIYEHIFLNSSYGFRPKRDCHQAILDINDKIMKKKVNYIVDADIKSFFENVNHDWLMKFLEHDIQDKVFLRYIKRFLIGGVMEDGIKVESDKGTPQGGLISPILANVYLHYVLDLWFDIDIKTRYKGEVYLARYADDFVVCFELEEEAKIFYEELKERLAKFELELAEDKSKIIKFGRNSGDSKESFEFLGFTHTNGKTRQDKFKLMYTTSKKKMKDKKKVAKKWIKENVHIGVIEIIKKLNIKLLGHYRYYGITNNYNSLLEFYNYCKWTLYKALKRRSQKGLILTKYYKILEYNPIVKPRIYLRLW